MTLVVARPQVVDVRRRTPGDVSAGDRAAARVEPGLVRLLEHPWAGANEPLGAGYHAPYTVPLGLAITAALALLDERAGDGRWTARRCDLHWRAGAGIDDTLRGEASVLAFAEHDARVALTARSETGTALFDGEARFVRVRADGFAALAPIGGAAALRESAQRLGTPAPGVPRGAEPAPGSTRGERPLLQWTPPRLERDAAGTRLVLDTSVLQLLVHPLAGGSEPLGRRTHPLTGIVVGACLSAALAAAGADAPWRANPAIRRVGFVLLREVALDDRLVATWRNGDARAALAHRVTLHNAQGAVLATAEIDLDDAAGTPSR